MTRRRGCEDPSVGILSMCEGGRGGRGGRGDEEDDDDGDEVNGDEVNGDEVNGDVLPWHAATRNGAA